MADSDRTIWTVDCFPLDLNSEFPRQESDPSMAGRTMKVGELRRTPDGYEHKQREIYFLRPDESALLEKYMPPWGLKRPQWQHLVRSLVQAGNGPAQLPSCNILVLLDLLKKADAEGGRGKEALAEKLLPLDYAILGVLEKSPIRLTRERLKANPAVTRIASDPKTIRAAVNRLLDRKYLDDKRGLAATTQGKTYLKSYPPTDSP